MNMPADCLTKRLGNRTLLRLIMRIDKYAITEAGSDKLWETPKSMTMSPKTVSSFCCVC